METVFNLPNDIYPDHAKEKIIFHHYTAPPGSFKGKSMLHTNAISLVVKGEKKMHFANKTVIIQEDEFHFLSVGNCVVTMDVPENQPLESMLIFFDNQVFSDFYLKYKDTIAKHQKNHHILAEPYLAFKKDEFVRHYMTSLELLFRPGTTISTEMKLLKFEELMLHLLEKHPLQLLSFPLSHSRDLDDLAIRKAVENNLLNPISIEELAFICNLGLSTFKRRFAKIYGTAPSKWILQKRMERAKELIVLHKERPSEVYHKVGYENHSSFTQSFKQFYGYTPTAILEAV